MTAVLAATGLCPPGPPQPGWVAVDDDTILEIGTGGAPAGAHDLGDMLLAPGYLDLQINGVAGVDFADAEPAAWRSAARALLAHGVTAYCPTLVSAPTGAYQPALARVAAARAEATAEPTLPAVLGVHLEGPFLGDAPGAHPRELLQVADSRFVGELLDTHPGLVRMMTLAPEADPGLSLTARLVAAGVVVALGHSRASYEQAVAAADAGATVVTHVFNGMGPLHHREPGLAGAALDDDRLVPTVIADLVHVHHAVLRLVLACKRNVVLVSDAVALTDEVREDRGAARFADGTLVGATTLLDRAVANVHGLGLPVERAVALATELPATVIGAGDRGRITPGARADLVALDPGTLAVRGVWIGGEEVPASSMPV